MEEKLREDYDPETTMSLVTLDCTSLKDWVDNPRPSWLRAGEKRQYGRYARCMNWSPTTYYHVEGYREKMIGYGPEICEDATYFK